MAVFLPLSSRPSVPVTSRTPVLAAVLALGLQGCMGAGSVIPPGEILALNAPTPVNLSGPQTGAGYPVLEPASSLSVSSFPDSGPQSSAMPQATPVLAAARPQMIASQPVDPVNTQTLAPTGQGDSVMAASASSLPPRPSLASPPLPTIAQTPETRLAFVPRMSDPMAKSEPAGGMPAEEIACRRKLKDLGVTFRNIAPIGSEKGCGIPYPVELIALSGGIEIKPAAKVNCQITEAFARWVKDELAPAARTRYLSGVKSINQLSSYSCRTMNSQPGAPMSEHSRGNAIDIGKITLNSGKSISVRRPGFFAFREKSLLNNVRAGSCDYFTTVLGPGSDVHHKNHFHFDLRKRKSGYRHCDL